MSNDGTPPGSNEAGVFHRLRREPPLSDRVADHLMELVSSGRLKAGELLPSERRLGEDLGVSRTVIREAVRSLSAKGVLQVRSGSGVRVATPDSTRVVESMRLFLGDGTSPGSPVTYEQVHEIRVALEVRMAASASHNAADSDILSMSRAIEDMDAAGSEHDAAMADLAFHNAIAVGTQNPLYPVMMDSMSTILFAIRRATVGDQLNVARGLWFHRQILDRIVAGDAPGAAESMQRHLDDAALLWQSPQVMADADWRPDPISPELATP